MFYWLVNSLSEKDCFNRIPFKHQDFHNQGLSFRLTCRAENHSWIFYQLWAFEIKLLTGEMSNHSLPCRYRGRGKNACLTRLQSVQSGREQKLWKYYSFIYGDCKLSLRVVFYLTVAGSWYDAQVWKSSQVHILFMVHLSGKKGIFFKQSLSHSLRQVMNLDPM